MNRLGRSAAVLFLFGFMAGAEGPVQKPGVRWSPLLKLDSRKAIEARLAQPFGDVFEGTAQGEKATIANCSDYLRLSTKGFHAGSDMETRVLHNDAVDCVALNLLRMARVARASRLTDFQMNAEALHLLPPELAPAVSNELIEKAKAADAAGESWKTYVPGAEAVIVGPEQIRVSQPGWKTQVSLYARGDFSGKGKEELLVRADYEAVGGTYRNSELFLLGAGKAGVKRLRLIREISVP